MLMVRGALLLYSLQQASTETGALLLYRHPSTIAARFQALKRYVRPTMSFPHAVENYMYNVLDK